MSEERALLWEAWAISLDDPGWAANLRQELDFLTPSSARDLLLQLLSRGPHLHGAWSEWREALRQDLPAEAVEALFARGRALLEPDPDFAAYWQRVSQTAGRFRSRGAYVRVAEQLFRSPQPRLSGLSYLKETYGLTGVINLREESEESRELCQQLGLSYRWLPVPDMQTPQEAQVDEFLECTREGIQLVHCFAGQGRTGLFVACFRMARGVPPEEAIRLSDAEIFSRGMRQGQREWVRRRALNLTA
jgi:protein tyrosine phosphatase (PTP) superfamily phosphohydrolase (DUF442 family)